ncbi:MAG: hypothetical protein WB808_12715 [Candidatus Dormiibacterota bacterium]
MMNPNALHDLARERSRDLIDTARSRRQVPREFENLDASDVVFLFGRSAHVIDARARAAARLRVTSAAFDLS